ncbi:hypothetical protein CRE_24226 [Caenorhabditis remanei]|uniref:Uncharacterized protein n=1 Tax=Caenorhabditis remanei TaxID=31234 RepID=E3NCW9_CAERE|nr:hypothetical protein CRE_24226 [Caenorhabditis remanei]
MFGKPMTYLSIQTVLSHLESNKRMELSANSSYIKQILYRMPQKFPHLEIGDGFLVVGSTYYTMSIVRNYMGGEAPEYFQNEKEDGGVTYDVGKFAHPECRFNALRNDEDAPPTYYEIETARNAKKRLNVLHGFLKKDRSYPAIGRLDPRLKRGYTYEAKSLEELIKRYEEKVRIAKLEYKECIVLNKMNADGTTVGQEMVEYSISLKSAWAYFLKRFFVVRKETTVEKLRIFHPKPHIMLQGLQLRVNDLILESDEKKYLSEIQQNLSIKSFPLKSIEVRSEWVLDHPMITTANQIIISGGFTSLTPNHFSNGIIRIKPSFSSAVIASNLLNFYQENGCSERKDVIIETDDLRQVKEVLKVFEPLLKGFEKKIKSSKLPIHFPICIAHRIRPMNLYLIVTHMKKDNQLIYSITMFAVPKL